MLISLQFPFADSRLFLTSETGILKRPTWPAPETSEFVRSFGGIRLRKLGGVKGWIGENEVCEAIRALRFTSFPVAAYRCAFRRFFFDGYALGKFEIGITSRWNRYLEGQGTEKAINSFLSIPVQIRDPSSGIVGCALGEASSHIVRSYLASTTTRNHPVNPQPWWVKPGIPLLFLEYREDETINLSKRVRVTPVDIPEEYGIKLGHCYVEFKGQQIPMWIMGRKYYEDPAWKQEYNGNWFQYWDTVDKVHKARFFRSRTLRLYLLRLHAEHQCLRIILRHIAIGNIPIIHGNEGTERLQRYLNDAIKRVTDWEFKSEKLVEADVARLARESEDAINPGQREALLALFERENLRFTVRRKVSEYTKIVVQEGGIVNMADEIDSGDKIEVHGGQVGAIGRNAHVHDVNFSQVWGEIGGDVDLQTLSNELSRLIPELRKRASEKVHDEAILAVGDAAEAAKEGNGPKVLQYLKKAGEWTFKVATDVGVKVAAEAIKQSLYPGSRG